MTTKLAITPDGAFGALHTGEVLSDYRRASGGVTDAYDLSIYIIDILAGGIRARYSEQIPGIETGSGSRNMQIWDMRFVSAEPEPYLALFEERPDASSVYSTPRTDAAELCLTMDDISGETTLIDMDGNIVQFGRPDIDQHPDHYYLSADTKERLEE